MAPGPPLLDVCDLRKSYGSHPALLGVSFQVQPGEIFGLLGPNGAGKTTLLSIISGLLFPTAGTVLLSGEPFSQSRRDLKPLVGITPQELAIYGELTARENLLFFGQLYSIPTAVLEPRIESILQAIGLAERGDDRAETFSGGMKRRLNLGASLVHGPRLLLLDEPTTGVDPQSRNHIFQEIRRLNSEGMTMVYTSHYMEEVQALCTRIGIIDHGRLIACDTVPNLLQKLPGSIRFGVPALPGSVRERLPEPIIFDELKRTWVMESNQTKDALIRLITVLQEEQIELASLEIEEPNLERVFLHLTGRALRD